MAMAQTTAEVQPVAENDDPRAGNMDLIDKALAAYDSKNHEAFDDCIRLMHRDAEDLLAVKHILGADWIRKMRLDTTPAEKKYGSDWLDRDI